MAIALTVAGVVAPDTAAWFTRASDLCQGDSTSFRIARLV
jgi:hypothetical protein